MQAPETERRILRQGHPLQRRCVPVSYTHLGCQVLEISALKGTGIRELIDAVVTTTASDDARTPPAVHFPDHLEKAIGEIGEIITGKCLDQQKKWFAVKVFEREQKVADQLALNPEEQSRINGIIETM